MGTDYDAELETACVDTSLCALALGNTGLDGDFATSVFALPAICDLQFIEPEDR